MVKVVIGKKGGTYDIMVGGGESSPADRSYDAVIVYDADLDVLAALERADELKYSLCRGDMNWGDLPDRLEL